MGAHGVMNTDNLSLLGITVDLNVYGFLAKYDVDWAPNLIDDEKRYAFGSQRAIAKWNLRRLADALVGKPFEADSDRDAHTWPTGYKGRWLQDEVAVDVLERFDASYDVCYVARMELRLG